MSGDLYQDQALERISNLAPVQVPEAGAFDGFLRGSAMATMKGFAKTGRALDMAGAALPVAYDAITGGTEAQDRYFKEHDEVFGSAVDAWTPKPNEVGAAGEIVGSLLSTLPVVIASPSLAVASAQLSGTEDLAKKGVSPTKAIAAGAVEGAALGTGIWMPILGNNLWQRMALGGAGFNMTQGVAARAAEGMILEGTPEAENFKAFDSTALTLDALMGMAFGAVTHVSPHARAQGKETWEKISAWAEKLNPSDVDSILVLRQAQHLNEDSLPGTPLGAKDINDHVQRVRTAIDDIVAGREVKVDDMPAGKFEPDAARFDEAQTRAGELSKSAEEIRTESDLPKPPETEGPQAIARTGTPPGEGGGPARPEVAKEADPLAAAAHGFVDANKDMKLRVGTDADGAPIHKTASEFLKGVKADAAKAKDDSKLFSVAAECMLGIV